MIDGLTSASLRWNEYDNNGKLAIYLQNNKEDNRATTDQISCKIDALNVSSFLFDDIDTITSYSFPFPICIQSRSGLKIHEKNIK